MNPDTPIWTLCDAALTTAGVTRLHSATLSIAHEVTSVIGYSGAGKTSLLNLLARLERPSNGTISFRAPCVSHKLPLYWVPQDGGLWSHLSVREHVATVRDRNSAQRAKTCDFSDNLLTQFDLLHRHEAFPGDLSMGERSRLAVARAIAAQAAVLIMDEPLSHVDPVRQTAYWNTIRTHVQQSETSLIFSTHEPETALRESQSVICMKAGHVVFTGATADLYTHPPSEETGRFLGPLNWFTSDDAVVWLNIADFPESALRPENIRLVADSTASCEILSFRFAGSYAETTLQHGGSGSVRTVLHRPTAAAHQPGQRVRVEVFS